MTLGPQYSCKYVTVPLAARRPTLAPRFLLSFFLILRRLVALAFQLPHLSYTLLLYCGMLPALCVPKAFRTPAYDIGTFHAQHVPVLQKTNLSSQLAMLE